MKILKSVIFFILYFCLIAFIQSNVNVCSAISTFFIQTPSIEKTFNYIEGDNHSHSIYVASSNQELTQSSQRKRFDLTNSNFFNINSKEKELKFETKSKIFYKSISYTPPKLFLTELYINAP